MSKRAHSKNAPVKEIKEFEEEVLELSRVTRVVKGGRRLRFRATVVIGNRNGKVGVGIGKSDEVVGSIQKAISDAKKNLIVVKMDGSTIPHDVSMKYKSASILLMPAAPGTGIIAGGTIRRVVELAGIKDVLSKSFGTTNKIACSRATLEALKILKENPFMQRKADRQRQLAAAKSQQPVVQKPVAKQPATQTPKTSEPVANKK